MRCNKGDAVRLIWEKKNVFLVYIEYNFFEWYMVFDSIEISKK